MVPSEMNFHELRSVIQFAMGWMNIHFRQFIVGLHERCTGILFDDGFGNDEMEERDDLAFCGM
ncbi:hypothetical protein [Haliscomenobacter sp.]|uniref:IS1096 element passenger TnpR family protein n=1 Tax=Haliscomenobacter sp. TaxID=2717303 RepID=UPI0033651752